MTCGKFNRDESCLHDHRAADHREHGSAVAKGCAITTLVYSGTCGRRVAMIMFTSIALPPPGLPPALALGDVICVLMLSSSV